MSITDARGVAARRGLGVRIQSAYLAVTGKGGGMKMKMKMKLWRMKARTGRDVDKRFIRSLS